MRLLVDECCDPRLVAALREAGHDVRYVLETDPGSDDDTVVALSIAEDRILITEDKDFGELAVRRRAPLPGLVLLRFAPENRHRKPEQVVALLARHGDGLRGRYAVVDERSVVARAIAHFRAPDKRPLKEITSRPGESIRWSRVLATGRTRHEAAKSGWRRMLAAISRRGLSFRVRADLSISPHDGMPAAAS